MTDRMTRLPDPARSRLRASVASVESAVSRLSSAATEEAGMPSGLLASWRELVGLLALGPEPEYRECPACGQVGMHSASVCGYCWTPLAILPKVEVAPAAGPPPQG